MRFIISFSSFKNENHFDGEYNILFGSDTQILLIKKLLAKARMSAVAETVGESRLDTGTEAALIVRTRLHLN